MENFKCILNWGKKRNIKLLVAILEVLVDEEEVFIVFVVFFCALFHLQLEVSVAGEATEFSQKF